MSGEDYKEIYKVILVGDSGVGKSNILSRYTKDEFHLNTRSTVGVEFGTKIINTGSNIVKAQIWDTAGQERYRALTTTYYKGSNGAFLVYDITKRNTFQGIERWYHELINYTDLSISIILVGNKCDLNAQREITQKEGEAKAKSLGLPFFETSALSNVQIDVAFDFLVEDILKKNTMQEKQNAVINDDTSIEQNGADINLTIKSPSEKRKKCCCI